MYLRSAGGFEPAVSSFDGAALIEANDAALVDVRAHRAVLDLTEVHTRVPGIRLYPVLVAADLAGFLTIGEREGFEEMPADIDRALTSVVVSHWLTRCTRCSTPKKKRRSRTNGIEARGALAQRNPSTVRVVACYAGSLGLRGQTPTAVT